MALLVTGGAGYIGSHLVKELVTSGYHPIVLDNLSEGHRKAIHGGHLVEGDLKNFDEIHRLFTNYRIDGVFHLAACCYVGESVEDPQKYYLNNLLGTLNLLRGMLEFDVKRLIFSSTAATYGVPEYLPLDERHRCVPISPYGKSKWYIEEVMLDYARAHALCPVMLRYFNAAGADPEGDLGEAHRVETHLIPLALKVALGQAPEIEVYGTDYPTGDGTCIRDYIHVTDLARAHVLAYEKHFNEPQIFNLGSGRGFSVREVLEVCRKVTGCEIREADGPRRPGDPPSLVAGCERAMKSLAWKPELGDLTVMVETAWRWHQKHPNGYTDETEAQKEFFGEIAIRMGFVSHEQLDEALRLQKEMDRKGTHKLLGMLMLTEGMLSNSQLIQILKYMEAKAKQGARPAGSTRTP
jgi:UDP-glucose 4-epimerase